LVINGDSRGVPIYFDRYFWKGLVAIDFGTIFSVAIGIRGKVREAFLRRKEAVCRILRAHNWGEGMTLAEVEEIVERIVIGRGASVLSKVIGVVPIGVAHLLQGVSAAAEGVFDEV
jgi:tartrate dehydratase alpha subunit/fumarate hydratase class I-like protein